LIVYNYISHVKEKEVVINIFRLFFLYCVLFYTLNGTILYAENSDESPYSLRLGYGVSETTNLGDILIGDWQRYEEKTSLLNLDAGYKLVSSVFDWPIDIYAKGSLSYFNEKGVSHYVTGEKSDDFLELALYFKAYWNIDFVGNRVRFGIGEGLSFAQEVPIVEIYDAMDENELGPTSKILNYLDISLDIDIGRLLSVEALKDTYLGYTLKHRSGIFGLFNDVKGGSNYNMITLEKNF
jgi:outer membrane protein